MPIFRGLFALTTVLILGACLAPPVDVARDAPRQIAVTDLAISLSGPPGFCVDLEASRVKSDRAFVLLASCAAISNQPLMPKPDVPVVLTASVSSGQAPTSDAMDRHFHSPAGLSQLRSFGPVGQVTTKVQEHSFFVHAAGENGDQWRGFVLLSDAIVTLALRPTSQTPIPKEVRGSLLEAFADRIIAANPRSISQGGGS